ncbi:hypothetical protein LUX57_43860 [Actinomadura madurae]|uniref:hypothetical protein n=1 Tax=Actinomadura madurae TaxID=1993 RepID=UPI0020D20924|nr:hypothetical protein [Actinomadura madurae]MCP9971216.1 hypothetical protein [Actinomadura madurae]
MGSGDRARGRAVLARGSRRRARRGVGAVGAAADGRPVIHSSPSTPPGPTSIGSPTARPSPGTGEDKGPKPSKSPKAPAGGPTGTPTSPKPHDNVRSFATRGGRAAMAIEKDRVRLVSATPNPGYETRVTQAEGWLRVDFLSDKHTSSVVASWYGHDPAVKVYEY